MKNMRKILTTILLALVACTMLFAQSQLEAMKPDDIVVLYTNDVHCAIDENIGYAGLAAFKAAALEKTPYVALVDCGDAVQGAVIGTVSNGEFLVDIMNKVGYDFGTLGNHEFDYGMAQLSKLIDKADMQYLSCNIEYTGKAGSALTAVKPYEIVSYGLAKVAFIGVSTPETITKSTPAFFQENDQFVYSFAAGNDGLNLAAKVQATIDEVLAKGVDYVILVAHLGDDPASAPYRSTDLIANICGVDVVLDGHSHSTVSGTYVLDKEGHPVLYSSTGTKLANIGQLVISADGYISTGLVKYPVRDEAASAFVNQIKASYETAVNKVVASTSVKLTTKAPEGYRLVRSRETNLGDLCADAYRTLGGADIGLINGGGIRADLKVGDITLANIIAVHPYGNVLCTVKATGAEILDCLEMSARNTQGIASANGNAVGENGGFLQVSGLKFTIDTSVPTPVKLDANLMFAGIEGPHRIKDVLVLNAKGEYEPLDLEKTYTVASHNYMIKQGGDGYTMFKDNELVLDETMIDNQVLITYITEYLGGVVPAEYTEPQGRITVK
jgi:5'-nucleotidase/UDP-sugar diphosphatase